MWRLQVDGVVLVASLFTMTIPARMFVSAEKSPNPRGGPAVLPLTHAANCVGVCVTPPSAVSRACMHATSRVTPARARRARPWSHGPVSVASRACLFGAARRRQASAVRRHAASDSRAATTRARRCATPARASRAKSRCTKRVTATRTNAMSCVARATPTPPPSPPQSQACTHAPPRATGSSAAATTAAPPCATRAHAALANSRPPR